MHNGVAIIITAKKNKDLSAGVCVCVCVCVCVREKVSATSWVKRATKVCVCMQERL